MQIKIGYFYFIKDKFFEIIDDEELMQNKENGNKRPCYFCFKRKENDKMYIVHFLFKICFLLQRNILKINI